MKHTGAMIMGAQRKPTGQTARTRRHFRSFGGAITTSGNSHAIRFETALVKEHPEFGKKGSPVRAHYIGAGQLLLSVDAPQEGGDEDDPVLSAWLSFLEEDMKTSPNRMSYLTTEDVARIDRSTEGVVASDDDVIPEDVTF